MFRFIIGVIISVFMLALLRMIMSAISGAMNVGGGSMASSKSAGGSSAGSSRGQQQQPFPPKAEGGELHKCPVCSTYHTVSNVAGRTAAGEVILFCSNACREKYAKV